jgi:hypothetical protein
MSPSLDSDSQFADLQSYLVLELSHRAWEVVSGPQEVAGIFLDGFPEVLALLKSTGEEEARAIGCYIPTCFGERIERLKEVANRLRGNIISGTVGGNEAAIIIVQLQVHVNKLAIGINGCGSPSLAMADMARRVADVYYEAHPDAREGGYAGLFNSEPYIAWIRLDGAKKNCDACNSKWEG